MYSLSIIQRIRDLRKHFNIKKKTYKGFLQIIQILYTQI